MAKSGRQVHQQRYTSLALRKNWPICYLCAYCRAAWWDSYLGHADVHLSIEKTIPGSIKVAVLLKNFYFWTTTSASSTNKMSLGFAFRRLRLDKLGSSNTPIWGPTCWSRVPLQSHHGLIIGLTLLGRNLTQWARKSARNLLTFKPKITLLSTWCKNGIFVCLGRFLVAFCPSIHQAQEWVNVLSALHLLSGLRGLVLGLLALPNFALF